jgi:hypothetical protein
LTVSLISLIVASLVALVIRLPLLLLFVLFVLVLVSLLLTVSLTILLGQPKSLPPPRPWSVLEMGHHVCDSVLDDSLLLWREGERRRDHGKQILDILGIDPALVSSRCTQTAGEDLEHDEVWA